MKNFKILVSIILIGVAFTGCSSTPKCSDERVIKTLEGMFGKTSTILGFNYIFDKSSIRTVDENSKTGMYTCKIQTTVQASDEKMKMALNNLKQDITYTVSVTDDKKNFYVEIIQ